MPLEMEIYWAIAAVGIIGGVMALCVILRPRRQTIKLTPEQERIPILKPPGAK